LNALRLLAIAGGLLAVACAPTTGGGRSTPVPTVPPRTAVTMAPAGTPGGAAAAANPSAKQWPSPPPMSIDVDRQYFATIKTTLGDITVELFAREAPQTVNNFVFLAREGFYDNVKFHRIIKDFMVQTGDPTGTGAGGPGYRFADEPVRRDYEAGTLAMANAGPNTNGSQFFIMHGNRPLPKNYTIFGKVVSGMDVVDRIANVPVRPSPQGEQSVPTQDVRILDVAIEEKEGSG
jgi:cyclophilin family peptidyl-prolyl cis-trans isomerase